MPRSTWKGFLRLGLVSCAVALYPATSTSGKVSFSTLNRKTGNRLRQEMVDAVTGTAVPPEDQVKGYESGPGSYVIVADSDIEAIKLDSEHQIDLDRFVRIEEVDDRYLAAPCYIAPSDPLSRDAFVVVRDALGEGGLAAIGRIVMGRKERMIAVERFEDGLLGSLLRSASEVRGPEAFQDISGMSAPPDLIEMALKLMKRKSAAFDPATFEDRYEAALLDLLRSKVTQKPPTPLPSPNIVGAATQPYGLREALRASLLDDDKKKRR